MTDFDLFKVLIIATIVCTTIAIIGVGLDGFVFDVGTDIDVLIESLRKPFEIKNWHYLLLLFIVYIKG
jgi:hypothetical protein